MARTWLVIFVFLVRIIGENRGGYVGDSYSPYSYQFVQRQFEKFVEDEGSRWLCFMIGFCTNFYPGYPQKPGFAPVYQWSQLEFDYESPQERQLDIDSGTFVPGTPAPIDVDVYYSGDNKNRIFVTIPRFQSGIPVTLGTVSDKRVGNNPVITPYPSWEWHRNPGSCGQDRIVSVYRVQIDECGRLWVLDTGRLLEVQTCPPQILAFDLKTNELIHRYEIPSNLLDSRSILVTPIVDVRDPNLKCRDTFVYIADCQAFSIIVYDVMRGVAWRAIDKTMYPYPNYGTYTIEGESFDLMDGVLGMALSPYRVGADRKLFYHAMSSPTENWVYTSHLRNQSRFMHDPSSSPEIFHTYKGERRTQSAAEATDHNGIMYFGLMSEVTINCWNTHTEYGPTTRDVVAQNRQTLQFPSGMKVITNRRGVQELWVMTSRFQKVATGSLRTSETNFRIQAAKIDDLIFSSRCKQRPDNGGGGGYGLIKPSYGGGVSTGHKKQY